MDAAPAPRRWVMLLTVALAVYALWRVWALRWCTDDAFISFRYARNLIEGNGLVYNPGERVEGMTNLLWTLLLAAGMVFGADAVALSEALGGLCFFVSAGVLALLERRFMGERTCALPATWILLAMADLHVWATGGLETMAAAMLALLIAWCLFGGPSDRRELAAGILAGLLFLTRPDGALIAAVLGMGYALGKLPDRRRVLVSSSRIAGPAAVILIGATIFRLAYYGDPVPNTFFAKSTSESAWVQGADLLGLLFLRDWVLLLVLVAAAWGACKIVAREARIAQWTLLATVLVFGAYVVRSGGDFMFARRFVPVLPLLLLAASIGVREAASARHAGLLALALTAAALVPLPIFEIFGSDARIRTVADERAFYPAGVIAMRERQGRELGRIFEGLPARFMFQGGLCVVAYYSELPVMIEPNGLTDRTVARSRLPGRALPGHEKHPTEEYLDQRGVQFVMMHSPGPINPQNLELTEVSLWLYVRYYDPEVMRALVNRPDVRLTPIEALLSSAEKTVATGNCERAKHWLGQLDGYYFLHSEEGKARRAAFADELSRRCFEVR